MKIIIAGIFVVFLILLAYTHIHWTETYYLAPLPWSDYKTVEHLSWHYHWPLTIEKRTCSQIPLDFWAFSKAHGGKVDDQCP